MEKGLNELFDCKQSTFAYVFEQYGLEYRIVATGRLLFEYDLENTDSIIGRRIRPYPDKPVPWFKVLELQEEEMNLYNDYSMLDKYIEHSIPCVMTGDLFNCDWCNTYQKYHFKHYWLITRKEGADYIITDTYLGNNEIRKSLEELLQLNAVSTVYIRKKCSNDVDEKISKIIKEDAEYYLMTKMHKKISAFAEDLLNADLRAEKICADLYAVPILDNLKIVAKQRGAYAFLIDSMRGKINIDCKSITELLRESQMWWEKIRISLTKSIMKRCQSCEKAFVEEALSTIREIETVVMKELIKL